MTIVGHFSLSPLFFTPTELILIVLMQLFYSIILLSNRIDSSKSKTKYYLESLYLIGLLLIEILRIYVKESLHFLPLMITSMYTALGISYSFLKILIQY